MKPRRVYGGWKADKGFLAWLIKKLETIEWVAGQLAPSHPFSFVFRSLISYLNLMSSCNHRLYHLCNYFQLGLLNVIVRPDIVRISGNEGIVEGGRARLICEATGYPRPTIHWTKGRNDYVDKYRRLPHGEPGDQSSRGTKKNGRKSSASQNNKITIWDKRTGRKRDGETEHVPPSK